MLKSLAAVIAGLSLLACLGMPFLYFRGAMAESMFQWLFAVASIAWFVGATMFASQK